MSNKLQTIIGVSLVALAIFGFLFIIISGLPKDDQVSAAAHPLRQVPSTLFSDAFADSIRKLSVPNGVPVTVQPEQLGRDSVFDNF